MATLVDMTGPGSGVSMGAPFASGTGRPARTTGDRGDRPGRAAADSSVEQLGAQSRIKYTTPQGWQKQLDASGMSVATFQVGDGAKQAKITVVPLPGPAGGLAANINRWRGQLGLGPASEDDIRKELQEVEIAGAGAPYVDLTGPESPAGERQRILGVAVEHGAQTWFLKMVGPSDVVGMHKTEFEVFARSMRFQ
jgi:hypothetical protein